MTNEQAKKMIKAKLECVKRETSGTDFDCNNSNCDECPLYYEQGNMGEQKKALDMAIKALEQEPCEDTISRQAALDVLDVLCQEHRYKIPGKIETYSQYNEAWQDALDRAEGAIFNLPSAQPEVRTQMSSADDLISRQAAIDALYHVDEYNGRSVEAIRKLPPAQPERMRGKWIDAVLPNDNGGLPVQVCDQCNTFFPLAYTGGGHRFCPSCGAKMGVEHD